VERQEHAGSSCFDFGCVNIFLFDDVISAAMVFDTIVVLDQKSGMKYVMPSNYFGESWFLCSYALQSHLLLTSVNCLYIVQG
jgi:hypothetical protein